MSVYDRAGEIKAFDETKAGVKGLVDAGITKIPRFFIHQNNDASSHQPPTGLLEIPIIDLGSINLGGDQRKKLVEKVKYASETLGFFQVVNHEIPTKVMAEMLRGVKEFHEQEEEFKKQYYSREWMKRAYFISNFDLYVAQAGNWRDTLVIRGPPDPPDAEEVPRACREIVFQYAAYVQKLCDTLLELLSEALGLEPSHLREMECDDHQLSFSCHYYPPCPEPHLTMGTSGHSDPSFLTVLLQDNLGGLQVLHQDHWINVPSLPGCLVVNIGDFLQLISNGKLKSVEHRVLASNKGPRISVASFFITRLKNSSSTRLYGPIKELLTSGEGARYKQILIKDYHSHFMSQGLGEHSALNHFKL